MTPPLTFDPPLFGPGEEEPALSTLSKIEAPRRSLVTLPSQFFFHSPYLFLLVCVCVCCLTAHTWGHSTWEQRPGQLSL